jgi:hypothetical protein
MTDFLVCRGELLLVALKHNRSNPRLVQTETTVDEHRGLQTWLCHLEKDGKRRDQISKTQWRVYKGGDGGGRSAGERRIQDWAGPCSTVGRSRALWAVEAERTRVFAAGAAGSA